MDEPLSPLNPMKCVKTYSKTFTSHSKFKLKSENDCTNNLTSSNDGKNEENEQKKSAFTNVQNSIKKGPLSTRNAVKMLLEDTLKDQVCRYCLNIGENLSSLEELITIGTRSGVYSIAVKEMIASFYPVKADTNRNFPSKICPKCLDRTINCYLFSQQCDQSERALRDCFEDIFEKVEKLDPLERTKKRGRQKLKPNYNIINTEHKYVIDYAEPKMHIISLINNSPEEPKIQDFECLKCSQILPDIISLLNHVKTHPKGTWFNCRLCGKSFPKLQHLKKHFRNEHNSKKNKKEISNFTCNECGVSKSNYQEFLQHIEKHKFKTTLEHVLSCNMEKLCAICFDKGSNMVSTHKEVNLHGGFEEITGEKSVGIMIQATLPEMTALANYTGSKICQKCFHKVLTTYLFTNQAYLVRSRLDKCITNMHNNLLNVDTEKNLCIEISQSLILPKVDINIEDDIPIDDNELTVEVLEDEFRVKEEESDIDDKELIKTKIKEESPKKTEISRLINGYQKDISEFLTFKKKKRRISKFTCPICNKHFVSEYFLKRHILKHANVTTVCIKCNMQFNSKFSLSEHYKTTHTIKKDSSYWTCKMCERIFNNQIKFLSHQKAHFYRNCQLCNKYFRSQSYFNVHMQRHLRTLRNIKQKYVQTCSFCEKECSNDNELSLHVNKVHLQIKPYNCDMCDQQYYTDINLKNHKKIHRLHSREKCSFCNKILSSRSKFVLHLRKHIDVKPFTCQFCTESFYGEVKLRKHLKIHFGDFR